MRELAGTMIDWTLFGLAVFTTITVAAMLVDFFVGHRRLRRLIDIEPAATGPRVSIVVAARNEQSGIEAGLASLLRLDYPALEIIVVNDRSTDRTGEILDRMARADSRLAVVHLSELPEGWLGKNYALYSGAARATGQLLLFTDADIVFEPSTLRRAVGYLEREALDHLTAIPNTKVPGVALNAFISAFAVFFSMYARPWKARDPRSSFHVGIGAFNLIRASAYRAIGTHQSIAMRPDDDLKLGKLVKKHHLRQDAVYARELLTVEWYRSIGEMIDGLMKNAFAGVNYSLLAAAGSTLVLCLTTVWPFAGLFVTTGWTRWLNGVSAVLVVCLFWTSARFNGGRPWQAIAFPMAALLFSYVIWRSALLAVTRGTVTWRGTAYPLARMRANRV
jgi:cellulose synthase/poly-beta-1,6-N-acetylglucosamine synthase-like glycosyltransferase